MEWNQLEYFLTVAQMQHVTRAAEALSITQPALSHSLAKLEEELGVQLFERSGRNVQLNRYGRTFAARVSNALKEIRWAKEEMRYGWHRLGDTVRRRFVRGRSRIPSVGREGGDQPYGVGRRTVYRH